MPFYSVDRLTGNLYGMEANSVALIPGKATNMPLRPQRLPQVNATIRTCPPDPSQTSSLSLGMTGMIPLVVKSNWVLQAVILASLSVEEVRGAVGTPLTVSLPSPPVTVAVLPI